MEIFPGNGWAELARLLASEGGTALILGATDTGKSTLARFLVETLLHQDIPVSLVDADIGQSSLCLPGTVGRRLFRFSGDLDPYRCEKFSFIGSVNPVPVIPFLVRETGRFVSGSRATSRVTLVDTTGLVEGEAGECLKTAKIRAVVPDRIVAIQRSGELEHILRFAADCDVVRLVPSPCARKRSRESRICRRSDKLAAYFRDAREVLLHTGSLEFSFQGKPLRHEGMSLREGVIAGLNRNGETAGLGVVAEVAPDSLVLRTPLRSLKGIHQVIFGTLSITFSP